MVIAAKHPTALEEIQQLSSQRPLTAEDLQALPDDGNRYEFIGGRLIVSPASTDRHQKVSFKRSAALDTYLTETGTGEGFAAPMDVHSSPNDIVQPDLLVVLRERSAIIQEGGIMGTPDLVIEMLSRSSISTDYLRKSELYTRSGVREYWIANPETETVRVQTGDGDRFILTGEYGRSGTLTSSELADLDLDLAKVVPTRSEAQSNETAKE
jgi:Uma2 family endonuclease